MLKPISKKAYALMHQGAIAFAKMESEGIRIDTDYLSAAIEKTTERIQNLSARLKADKVFMAWRKQFGDKTKIGSKEQLAHLIFNVMGHPITKTTNTGLPSSDEEHFKTVDMGFLRGYSKFQKLIKVKSTYLLGIRRETVGGFLHPFFNLHTTITYRSSSDSPNFQNMPVRDKKLGELIRRAIIARPNHYFIEIDFSGIEVKVAACYHKDPRMMAYIHDPKTDMHRDMAAQVYMTKPSQVSKDMRQRAKSSFVFPQFYGDFYINSAKGMWDAIKKEDLRLDGESIHTHLAQAGIKTLGACDADKKPKAGTFEHHMKKVEDDFWNNRFKVYNKWKRKWFDTYQREGGFNFYTGFRVEGVYKRNEVINSPIQGSAFHCLLWSLIRLQKMIAKRKMKTKIIGQIHDSIIADVHKDEKQEYLEMAQQVMTIDLRKHWTWLIVPIDVEAEASPLGGSWHEKEEVKI